MGNNRCGNELKFAKKLKLTNFLIYFIEKFLFEINLFYVQISIKIATLGFSQSFC